METETKQTSENFVKNVLAEIKKGKVKARSKGYFILKSFGFLIFSIFSFLIAIFLASFVSFALPLGGASLLLAIMALSALIFILLNLFLAKKFPSFYKRPIIFNLLIFLLVALVCSFVLLKTPFHRYLLNYSQNNNVPLITPLYKHGCGCGSVCSCGGQCSK